LRERGRNGVGPQKGGSNGSSEVPLVVESIWKSRVRKNVNEKDLGSCYRSQEDFKTSKARVYPLSRNE